MKRKFKFLSVAVSLVMAIPMLSFAAPKGNSGTSFDQKVLSRIDSKKAMQHISYLSETIGPRIAGTVEEKMASEYIKNELTKLGYDAQVQEFAINNVVSEIKVNGIDKLIRVNTATGSGYTTGEGISGKLVYCGLGNTLEDYPEAVKGNIAFIQRGKESFTTKSQVALKAGAIGVVLYNNVSGNINPTLGEYKSPIPFLAISLEDGDLIKDEMAKGDLTASIKAVQYTKSQNIIATRTPKNIANPEIVYVTGHYDTVPYAPGANDNASGTAMVLEFAKILKSYPIDKEVRFILCGAEEIGLIGSTYYVSQLSQDELDRSIATFNMDMIATSYAECTVLYTNTVDGKSNLVTEEAVKAGARLGNNILVNKQGTSSDHKPFGVAGIPAAGFIWASEAGELEPYYHTPDDNIKMNISTDRLQQASEIVGAALYNVIRKETPNLENKPVKSNDNLGTFDFGDVE